MAPEMFGGIDIFLMIFIIIQCLYCGVYIVVNFIQLTD